jgi:acyl-CoA synthetase (AMP-forming)/AMP-acid ligase II
MIDLLESGDANDPCLRDDSRRDWITYGELRERASRWSELLAAEKAVVFLYASNDSESVAAFLGAISAGHAIALLDPKLPAASQEALATAYAPEFVIHSAAANELTKCAAGGVAPHADLALLLSTSGSTGSPKFVRLTLDNVVSNARAISQVLSIGVGSVASGHLPLHYSYGLSVLTSHLIAGARVALTNSGFMDRDFWTRAKDAGITHLPGVPFHFSILERLGYSRLALPDLQCLTQAGGHLDVAGRERAHSFMEQRGGRFYVMYGQTEAAPRMSTLQHDDFARAPESVGVALPGGKITIHDPDENGSGEVVYSGPNVSMGYAESRGDLAKGDELNHVLHTGDLGLLDNAGRLTLTGRIKRSAKVFGLRVNLDEVEKLTNLVCPSAAVGSGAGLRIFYAQGSAEEIRALLLSRYSLPAASYAFCPIDELPRTERGKVNYRMLECLP